MLRRCPPELWERAVRMVVEISDQHDSEWAAICEVARLLGMDAGSPRGTSS
jgi:transposase